MVENVTYTKRKESEILMVTNYYAHTYPPCHKTLYNFKLCIHNYVYTCSSASVLIEFEKFEVSPYNLHCILQCVYFVTSN